MPRISVIIACRNYGRYLPDALASVRAQTFTDWECVVVDDASDDNTSEVLAECMRQEPRIRQIRNARQLGEAATRNVGNAEARGHLLAPLDADDWWEPDTLQNLYDTLHATPGAVLAFGGMYLRSPEETRTRVFTESELEDLDLSLRLGNIIPHDAVLVRREAVEAVLGYDEYLPSAPDWDLWLRLLFRFGPDRFACLNQPVVNVRRHGENISLQSQRMTRAERLIIWKILREDAWGLRAPTRTRQVLIEQTERELDRCVARKDFLGTAGAAIRRVSLTPYKLWIWIRFMLLFGRPVARRIHTFTRR